MRLAMVAHTYYPHDVRVRRECDALGDRGDRVDLICLRDQGEQSSERIGNVTVHRLPIQHARGQGQAAYIREYLGFFLRSFALLTRLFIRHRYPIVQVHNLPDFLVFVTLIPKILGARVLLDMHDVTPELFQSLYGTSQSSLKFGLLRFVEQVSLAYADAVLTVNRNIRDLFLARNPIAHKIEVVMNAPDPRYFDSCGSGASSPNGHFRLIHHGQIIRRYDFEVALEAVSIARDRIPDLRLDIYGDGEASYIRELLGIVDSSGLSRCVRFHKRVPLEQVPGLIRSADIGIVPCKRDVFVDQVMLPVRLLEYVASGLPAVVSRVGTVEAYFDDEEVAYYPPSDPDALANRIVELYSDPQRRLDMATRAKNTFRIYEWPRMKLRYYNVIDSLAKIR